MPTMTPAAATLPRVCFARHPSTGGTILVIRGEAGYHPVTTSCTPEQLNAARPEPPSRAQVAAMLAGSLFGWDQPIADPARHRPLDAGVATAPPAPAASAIAEWGGPDTPFRMQGCDAICRPASDSPDPLWSYAAGHLGLYGWMRVADRHAKRTFLRGLLQLPLRDWRDTYEGRVPPDEAAEVACDEYAAQHGTGPVAASDPAPPDA